MEKGGVKKGLSPYLVSKPLIVVLCLSGLYVSRPRCTCRAFVKTCFSLIPLLAGICVASTLLWSNAVALFSADRTSPIFVPGLFGMVHSARHLFLLVLFAYSASRYLERFFNELNGYSFCFDEQSTHSIAIFIGVVVGCFVLYMGVASVSVLYVIGAPVHPCSLDVIDVLVSVHCLLTYMISFLAMQCTLIVLWMPCVVYTVLWLLLYLKARRFNRDLEKHIFSTSPSPVDDVTTFRLRHLALCMLVEKANIVLCHFLFLTFSAGMPLLLLALHILIGGGMMDDFTHSMVYGMCHACGQLVLVTLTGAVLSFEMRKPSGLLLPLNLGLIPGGHGEINLFFSQLHTATTGFNVYHLFTIDASTILMVCGTILTYVVVIIQLNPNASNYVTAVAAVSNMTR